MGPQFYVSLIVLAAILGVFLLVAAPYLIYLERKIAAWSQNRIGPNRVGLTFGFLPNSWHMIGLGQPLADGIKFLAKEDYNPGNVDKSLFIAAPVLAAVPALIAWAVIPWGGELRGPIELHLWEWLPLIGGSHVLLKDAAVNFVVADINIGIVYILAAGSLAVYGVTIGSWASNNKYSFFGGLRATAQMLSYEIPMGLCVLSVLLLAGTVRPSEIIYDQVGYWHGWIPAWNILQMPLVAILFFICILAESNRAPFDVAECEQELIGGFHTEYSSMKFALFFVGEYVHMIVGSAFFTLLFLGGWHLPWLDRVIYGATQPAMVEGGSFGLVLAGVGLKVAIFLAKVTFLLYLMMWIRWTLPRFRFDQLMRMAWRGLIPLTIGLLLITGVFIYNNWGGYLWVGNGLVVVAWLIAMPFIPSDKTTNARVPLSGSRFSGLETH
ncbi:MAG: complex I subunit 1 family protein [Phycisphaeraceae bacterium]|nr:complex I subunit 1 family protein [Phycisphaeraceae bacterium]